MRRPPPGRQSQCEGLTTEEDSTFPMDTQNPSVPPHAQTRRRAKTTRTGAPRRPPGLASHDNARHTTRFTVIGNHLAQHPELSAARHRARGPHPVAPRRRPHRHQDPRRPLPRGHDPYRRRPARAGGPRLPAPHARTHPRTAGSSPARSPATSRDTGRDRHADTPRPGPRATADEAARAPQTSPRRTAPGVPRPRPPPDRPPTSSPASAATTPASSSPPATPPTSPPASPPGWSATSPPPPYATP